MADANAANAANAVSAVVASHVAIPKSTAGLFELPCGYLDAEGNMSSEVEVREITGTEEDMLGSQNIPINKKIEELLVRCIKRIGTISDPAKIRAIVPDLTGGDRMFLVFAIRRVTFGDIYPFIDKCPECKSERLYQINLDQVEVYKMKDPRKRIIDVKLESGRTARFRLVYGKDEGNVQKFAKSPDSASLGILYRLELLDGKPPQLVDVKAMSMPDRQELREAMIDADGGVDTEIEVECPDCGAAFSRDVEIGAQSFFFPSGVRKLWKKRSSS